MPWNEACQARGVHARSAPGVAPYMEELVSHRLFSPRLIPAWIIAAALLAPSIASAQDEVVEAPEQEQFVAQAGEREDDNDITLTLNAGAALAYGNARSFGLTVGASFLVRQAEHQFVAEASYAYGIASVRIDPAQGDYRFGDFAPNTNNFNARARYDFFASPDDSIWGEIRLRNDPFAFLVPQFSAQAGYQRTLVREENHRLWFELGLDFSYQNYGMGLPQPILGMPGFPNELADRSIFAYKALLGYTNETNEVFTYNTRLEVLGTIVETVPTAAVDGPLGEIGGVPAHLRFQWVNQFRSKIEDWLQISLDITGRLDSLPPGQLDVWEERDNQPAQMFDLTATLNLVGQFDLDGEPASEDEEEEAEGEAAEPECPECECPVCEAPPEPATETETQTETQTGAASETEAEGGASLEEDVEAVEEGEAPAE